MYCGFTRGQGNRATRRVVQESQKGHLQIGLETKTHQKHKNVKPGWINPDYCIIMNYDKVFAFDLVHRLL